MIVRELRELLADLGDALLEHVDRWLVDQHAPLEDGTCSSGGHWRRTEWPCRDVIDAVNRRHARRQRHAARARNL